MPSRSRPVFRRFACLPVLLALAACGGDEDDAANGRDGAYDASAAEALPAPEGAVGSVTGMPAHPGPGTVPLTSPAPAPATGVASMDDPSATFDASASLQSTAAIEVPALPEPGVSLPAPPVPPLPQASPAPAPTVPAPPPADAASDDDEPAREFVVPEEPAATTSTTFRTAPPPPPDD